MPFGLHFSLGTRVLAHAWRTALRWMWIALGLVLMGIGLVGVFLPTHLLGVFLVLGLILVLRNSRRARRRFVTMQRRHPRYVYPLRRLLRRNPEVGPVVWHALLRTERFLPRRWRRLRRWRHATKVRPSAESRPQTTRP
jgi:hypothetical protein